MKTPIPFFDKSVITRLPKESYISKLLPRIQEAKTAQFTTLVLTLVAIGIFGFFAISPTLSTIAELNKQLDDSRFTDQKLSQKISNLSSLQQTYAKIQKDLPVVLGAIPTDPQMAILLGQIQSVAKQSNVELQHAQTFPVDITSVVLPPNASTSYGISFDVIGTPSQIGLFLDNITSFDRLMSIDTISLVRQSPTDINMRMSLKGKAFFKQQ